MFGGADFAGAFVSLLGDDAPPSGEAMQEFEDFLATIAFPPNPRLVAGAAPGMLWVTLAFAGVIGLGRAFDRERENDTIWRPWETVSVAARAEAIYYRYRDFAPLPDMTALILGGTVGVTR